MRVLHVVPSVAPRYGGTSQAVIGACRTLTKRGADITLATTDADGPSHLAVSVGSPSTYQGVSTIFFRRQWSEAFKYSHPLSTWLSANLRRYDLVHIHAVFSHACIAAAAAGRRLGVPYIMTPHGTLDPWSMRQKLVRKEIMWYLAARSAMTGATAIQYTTSDEQRLVESSLHLSRGVVVPLGIDVETYAVGSDVGAFRARSGVGDSPYVLVLSRLHPKKRLGPLIRAFLDVSSDAETTDWKLLIAGEGDPGYTHELKRIAANHVNGPERVIFAGWLTGSEKVSALQGASLMALPSLQENFGLVAIEAMSCSVPVLISTRVNLAGDVTRAGAGWVVQPDEDALRNGLKQALSAPDERQTRGLAGKRLVLGEFTWGTVAKQLMDLYSTVGAPGAKSGV